MTNESDERYPWVPTGPITGEEPAFLRDKKPDELAAAFFALASEVYVLRDRMRTLENVLERESVIAPNAIEDAEDNELQSRAREDEARQFSRRVLSQFYRPATSASRVGKKVEDMLD